MHAHLIDWFRNVHIHSDSKVVEQRWDAATKYSKKLSRSSICSLLRLFLFSVSDPGDKALFEKALLEIDQEFPVAGNDQELRLMAGVVMVVTFEESSHAADAFALGLRAVTALERQYDVAQPAILGEAESYLSKEAEAQRPDSFGEEGKPPEEALASRLQKLSAATEEAAPAAQDAFFKEIIKTIKRNREVSNSQILRLSEESALLWWLINEYSDRLKKNTAGLSTLEYALAAAVEASERTHVLPPSNSMNALISRALTPCRVEPDEPFSLDQLLGATDAEWRTPFVNGLSLVDSKGLLPIMTGLAKTDEFGNAASATQVLPNLCPGLNLAIRISAANAAKATYAEIMFLEALSQISGG
jgi:hypothetical protein